jgi:hypothetical protein
LRSRQERSGFGGLGCGGEDRLLVGLQYGQPGREILRVIRAGIAGNTQIGTEEGGSEFGYKLLHRIGLIAEALAELAIATGLGRSPMRQFMTEGRIVRFRRVTPTF